MELEEILNIKISETNLCDKTKKSLRIAGIYRLKNLVDLSRDKVKNIRNIGQLTMLEIDAMMDSYGLKYKSTNSIIEEHRVGIDYPLEELLVKNVDDLGLNPLICHSLKMFGNIVSVKDLLNKTTKEVANYRYIGVIGINELLNLLHELNLYLKDERENLQEYCLAISNGLEESAMSEEKRLIERYNQLSSERVKAQTELFGIERELLEVSKKLEHLIKDSLKK